MNHLLELLSGKTAYEQKEAEEQEEAPQTFIKLNKNAPYGQGAGQMNKPLKKKKRHKERNQSLQLLSVSPVR